MPKIAYLRPVPLSHSVLRCTSQCSISSKFCMYHVCKICYTQFDLTRLEKIDLSRLQNDLNNTSSSSSLVELKADKVTYFCLNCRKFAKASLISPQRRWFSPAHATCSAHWFLSCLRDLRRGPAKLYRRFTDRRFQDRRFPDKLY